MALPHNGDELDSKSRGGSHRTLNSRGNVDKFEIQENSFLILKKLHKKLRKLRIKLQM